MAKFKHYNFDILKVKCIFLCKQEMTINDVSIYKINSLVS